MASRHFKWGMGAVAPMVTQRRPAGPSGRGQRSTPTRAFAARHDKQETPASVTSTPGVMTNIREGNVDGKNCRP